jgi:hypothetical protein
MHLFHDVAVVALHVRLLSHAVWHLPFTCLFGGHRPQECMEAAQKLNSLWHGKKYAPMLRQPFSEDAISSLPKGIKLLQRSTEFMHQLAVAVQHCRSNSTRSPAHDVAAQQKFLQDLQQHNTAQLAAELLSWLQAWPDLPDALLYAGTPNASSRLQVAADLLWQGATNMLGFLLMLAHGQAVDDMSSASLELLDQLIGPCCTSGASGSS